MPLLTPVMATIHSHADAEAYDVALDEFHETALARAVLLVKGVW